jgi:hypothetical protein
MLANDNMHGAPASETLRNQNSTHPTASVRTSWSLFEDPLWLDCAAPGAWGAVEIKENGEIVGRLPYVEKRRFGFFGLSNPPLTPWLGPWIRDRSSHCERNLGHQHKILRQLVKGLPKSSMVAIQCAPEFTNLHALHSEGYDLGLSYTYRIEDLTDINETWKSFKHETRRHCRSAERHLRVSEEPNLGAVIDCTQKIHRRRNIEVTDTVTTLERVDDGLSRSGQRKIFVARDGKDRISGALYTVFDERHTFILAGGTDPTLGSPGTAGLLTWTAIKDAAGRSQRFDFLGSMIPSIETFVRSFGSRQVPQYRAVKQSRLFTSMRMLARGG